jgi:hypothetical protein
VSKDTLQRGVGYWIQFVTQETILIVGNQNFEDSITVRNGWNLIGTPSLSLTKNSILTFPDSVFISDFYQYIPVIGYVQRDTLQPGKGYWVKCKANGFIKPILPPQLFLPINNADNQPNALNLQWKPVQYAASYNIQVAIDSQFQTIITEDTAYNDTLYLLCTLEPETEYFWRVQSFIDNKQSLWSQPNKFTTFISPRLVPDDYALFAIVDGTPPGIWVFDANTLTVMDSLITYRTPTSLEISPDGTQWYTIWRDVADTLYVIDVQSKAILHRLPTRGYDVGGDKDKQFLITSGEVTEIWNRSQLTVIHVDSPATVGYPGVSSPIKNKFYSLGPGRGVSSRYDLDSFKIEKYFGLGDSMSQLYMSGVDLDVAPDERYLYATVFNYNDNNWYTTFHVFDLQTDSLLGIYHCGSNAEMGVSPNGEFVYLTEPLHPIYWSPPSQRILRYNVGSHTMEVFFKWTDIVSLSGGITTSHRIAMSPDSMAFFVTIGGGYPLTCQDERAKLLKIDTASKSLLANFEFAPNDQGWIVQDIIALKVGLYPRTFKPRNH